MSARILVVDDNKMVLDATVRGLRITGYKVSTATRPSDALKLFKAGERFAVVVSDLEMPGMHGDEFCREVQKIAPTPFILQSGHSSVIARAAECGASVAFLKPVHPTDLREALAKLIAKASSA